MYNHKLKGLGQRFEKSDEGDRQMGSGVVHCCYYYKIYLQLIDMGGLGLQRARWGLVLLIVVITIVYIYTYNS